MNPGAPPGTRVLVLQNCPGEGIGRYGQRLCRRGVAQETVQVHAGQPLPSPESCDAVIVGGTPLSANEIHYHDFLFEEARWLKKALDLAKPLLGIGFGAQLLAHLLGSEVAKTPAVEIGACPIRLTAAGHGDPLFQGFPKIFAAFQRHRETFAIPPWGLHLASGWECANQGFRMGSAVGLQFHLEMTEEDAGFLGELRADELAAAGKTRARVAREWREHETQMAELADRLIDNFLASAGHARLPAAKAGNLRPTGSGLKKKTYGVRSQK